MATKQKSIVQASADKAMLARIREAAKQGAQLVAMDLARAVWWRKAGVSGL